MTDAKSQASLGVVQLEWTYAIASGETRAQQVYVETLGVPRYLFAKPSITIASIERPGAPRQLQMTLDVAIRAPARQEDGVKLNHPEANYSWKFNVLPTGVDVKLDEAASQTRLSPAWDDVQLAVRESPVEIERVNAP